MAFIFSLYACVCLASQFFSALGPRINILVPEYGSPVDQYCWISILHPAQYLVFCALEVPTSPIRVTHAEAHSKTFGGTSVDCPNPNLICVIGCNSYAVAGCSSKC